MPVERNKNFVFNKFFDWNEFKVFLFGNFRNFLIPCLPIISWDINSIIFWFMTRYLEGILFFSFPSYFLNDNRYVIPKLALIDFLSNYIPSVYLFSLVIMTHFFCYGHV